MSQTVTVISACSWKLCGCNRRKITASKTVQNKCSEKATKTITNPSYIFGLQLETARLREQELAYYRAKLLAHEEYDAEVKLRGLWNETPYTLPEIELSNKGCARPPFRCRISILRSFPFFQCGRHCSRVLLPTDALPAARDRAVQQGVRAAVFSTSKCQLLLVLAFFCPEIRVR